MKPSRSFQKAIKPTFKKGAKMAGGVKALLDLNTGHSAEFTSPAAKDARRKYREQHQTEFMFMKCMDGRLNASVWTETPFGILYPMRNLGGVFNLGWIGLYEVIQGWHEYAQSKGRRCLAACTYHFSIGNGHRGCAGFNYDREAASASASDLKRQFDGSFVRVYGKDNFTAIKIGFETDYESLVLHGSNGEVVNLADVSDPNEDKLVALLHRLLPDLHEGYLNDLLPLIQGNVKHVAEIRASRRVMEVHAEHGEWVLAIGRGFDWLHEPNTALIINPFDYELPNAIEKAARILLSNLVAKRVDGNITLMSVAPYRPDSGREEDPILAEFKARELNRVALGVIRTRVPELMLRLEQLTATIDMDTRKLNVLELKQLTA